MNTFSLFCKEKGLCTVLTFFRAFASAQLKIAPNLGKQQTDLTNGPCFAGLRRGCVHDQIFLVTSMGRKAFTESLARRITANSGRHQHPSRSISLHRQHQEPGAFVGPSLCWRRWFSLLETVSFRGSEAKSPRTLIERSRNNPFRNLVLHQQFPQRMPNHRAGTFKEGEGQAI